MIAATGDLNILVCILVLLVAYKPCSSLFHSSATMFMEHWKRRQMRLNYIWNLTGFEDEGVNVSKQVNGLCELTF